jgi:hypothetical protein
VIRILRWEVSDCYFESQSLIWGTSTPHLIYTPRTRKNAQSLISTNSGFVASWFISVPGVYVYLSFCVHVRVGRLVLSSPHHHHHHHCFDHPSSRLSLIPVSRISRNFCILEMCVEMSTRRRVWVSRVQKIPHKYPPPHA